MKDKRHVLENVFIYHKGLLKHYQDLLQVGFETDRHFSLVWRDGALFAAVEIRHLSVAWLIDTSKILNFSPPKELAGTLDKEGWFQFSINKEVYKIRVKELLESAFKSGN